MIPPEQMEVVDDFISFGIHAFTTKRQAGNFSTASDESVGTVMQRWDALRATLAAHDVWRLATASQVHGARVLVHNAAWEGWLRGDQADGHVSVIRGVAMAVSIADCVPVFIVHPSGATAVLHSGWRGTAASIVRHGIAALTHRGFPAEELRIHLGPAICGTCYEVSPAVVRQLTGESVTSSRCVDLRALIEGQARASGVRHTSISRRCTRCDNDDFFSHRAGDAGRQVAVIAASIS